MIVDRYLDHLYLEHLHESGAKDSNKKQLDEVFQVPAYKGKSSTEAKGVKRMEQKIADYLGGK